MSGLFLAMAVAARSVATYSEQADPADLVQSVRFQQLPDGLLIGLRSGLPASISLPAVGLPQYPPLDVFTNFGIVGPEPGQSAEEFCKDRGDSCVNWFERSRQRQSLLAQLASRRFDLRDGEYRASDSAWQRLQPLIEGARERKLFEGLRAPTVPRVIAGLPYHAVLIPWEAFPPQFKLSFERAPVRLGAALYEVFFERPLEFRYGPCRLPLLAVTDRVYSWEVTQGFYFPRRGEMIETVYGWSIPLSDRGWAPFAASPQPGMQRSSFTRLGEDEYVCGPVLKYRKGEQESSIGWRKDGYWQGLAMDDRGFQVFKLDDGQVLVLQKPAIHSFKVDGGGWCGSAPVIRWKIYRFHGTSRTEAAGAEQRLYCDPRDPGDYDVEFSPDLRTIHEYRAANDLAEPGPWQGRTLEWDGGGYHVGPWRPLRTAAPKGFRRLAR